MNSVGAIFAKQSKDMFKNFGVLIMFIVFPVVGFALTRLIAENSPYIEDTMFIMQMAAMFVGMALILSVATIISEDRENKSLRFLIIAGVKPMTYLLGIGGVIFTFSIVTSGAFAAMSGFEVSGLINFMAVMLSGAIASILLGAIIGIFSKNQQAASGLAMPVGMFLSMGALAAGFNESVARVFSIFYTHQINVLFGDIMGSPLRPLVTIWINIAVLAIIFAIAFKKKGMRD